MADELELVMDLLEKTSLFVGLDEMQLARVANRTRLVNLRADESLPLEDFEGGDDYPFFVVYSGKVRLSPPRWRSMVDEILRHGDFIGADALFFGARSDYQVTAITTSLLLRIESDVLGDLLVEIPPLKDNLKAAVDVYRQIHSRRFEWLAEDEIVHLILRKHPAYLLVSLVLPVLLGWFAVVIYVVGSFVEISSVSLVIEWVGILAMIVALLWVVWSYIDWRNDYYIVSDRRVVWLEHVIGLYDSRQEAPLTAIKSEEVQSTLLGRYLGYGDVLVHTLMGRITFRNVGQPEQVKAVIIAQQELAIERQYDADLQAMDELINERMEPAPKEEKDEVESVSGEPLSPSLAMAVEHPLPGWETIVNFFKTRVEEDGTITYRKHIYILFRKVFLPSLLILLVFAVNAYLISEDISGPLILLLGSAFFIAFGLWWLYQFIDWRNDIYRITFDKIIDSERKPLGSEVTKSAYLDNILSLDYERLGLLGILLNFGNVIINVGTENKFIFWRIHNPARAQQDIFNRMYANRRAKEEAAVAKDREHMADYLAVYDRRLREARENSSPSNLDRESG
jgi:uncharacterized membrane protein YdbT with pleckstrin-like domain